MLKNKDRKPGDEFLHKGCVATVVKVEEHYSVLRTRITFRSKRYPSGGAIVVNSFSSNPTELI